MHDGRPSSSRLRRYQEGMERVVVLRTTLAPFTQQGSICRSGNAESSSRLCVRESATTSSFRQPPDTPTRTSERSESIASMTIDELIAKRVSDCTPNIDGPLERPLTALRVMNTYRMLFCRRCFRYDCRLHRTAPFPLLFSSPPPLSSHPIFMFAYFHSNYSAHSI